jgi:hypothetical protein
MDAFLLKRQDTHVKRVESALVKLQKDILNNLTLLRTNKKVKLEGIRVNLRNAQKIHRRVEELFKEDFTDEMKSLIKDFRNVNTAISRSYKYLDEATEFTDIDDTAMKVLRDGVYQDYIEISGTKKQKIIQSVYDLVVGGGDFDDVVTAVQAAITGTNRPGSVGRNLLAEARTLARDSIMQYQQQVNNIVAEEIKIDHFLYIGDIIATTREFCRRRVGKVYTRKQIDSWTFKWAGKSGPAFTHRGGYNCRHHWQGIRPEWMEGKKKLDVADWNLEQRERG